MKKIFTLLFLSFISFAVFSQTTYNWVPQTLSPGNNLQGMNDVNDTLVVVGYGNTFMNSNDNGISWSPVKVVDAVYDFNSLSINDEGIGLMSSRRAKIVNYSGIDDIYVNGKLLQTLDNGATWSEMDLSGIGFGGDTLLNPTSVGCYGLDLFTVECIDANNALIYVGWYDINTGSKVSKGAVYYTTDGGTIWSAITDDLGNNIITAIENVGSINYVAGKNTLFKNTFGTNENVDIYPNLVIAEGGDETIYIFDIDVISETEFYVVTATNGIFHTTDGGANFTKYENGAPGGGNDIKAFDDNIIMVLGSSSKSKVTVDGGLNWTSCYPGKSCWEIAGVFNDSIYALGKDIIYKLAVSDLATNPTNWVEQTLTDEGSNIQKMHIIDANNAIVVGYDEFAKTTSDNGITWTDVSMPELFVPGAEDEADIDFVNLTTSDGVSYATSRRIKFIDYPSSGNKPDSYHPGLIFKSTDNWKTWSLMDINEIGKEDEADVSKNPFNENCYGFDPCVIENITDSIIFVWANWYDTVAGYEGRVTHSRVFRSTDSGDTWFSVTDDMGSPYVTKIYFITPDTGYILGNKIFLKTTDACATYTNLYPILDEGEDDNMFIKGIEYINEDEYYIPTTSDGIWKTMDGGASFTEFEGISGTNDFCKLTDTRYLALGSSSKSKLSKDAGATWETCYPGSSIWHIAGIVNDSLYALAKGKIYKIALLELTSDVGFNESIVDDNTINIVYRPSEFEVISSKRNIDICAVYNICGKLIYKSEPNALKCIINHRSYAPGLYFVSTYVNGKRYTNKVIIK
ncbi:MAG: T9SS type A sorting domain-containing protein [Bacteroidales bacterium]|nr:T9SS type A sorting domain-containing protein [Bacteroidales bacterium]